MTSQQITLSDMVQCAEREYNNRLGAYPALVRQGKMTERRAEEELAVREAIYRYLKHDLEVVMRRVQKPL
jgi:hypothetical protein